eukprot:CAMPEP_0174751902 /NCGR_PEP_ID=MMETSP1094-20130205/100810_1 /TAXON_ID=156173 /ORGANISM="Chrysochromulina brevifilum, Strain UTEX LB 985" /LENGTH=43 /DNA_ID= /DNA_START= /DNA_END= /DNA_ORIENTATION=
MSELKPVAGTRIEPVQKRRSCEHSSGDISHTAAQSHLTCSEAE